MDFSNIKLVVSDMDGTLLNSKGDVSPLFFRQFKALQKHNVHFVAASGRQYHSIANKLDRIKQDITIIAENGGIIKRNDNTILNNYFPTQDVHELLKILKKIPEAHVVLCGEKTAFIESKDDNFLATFSQYYSQYSIVKDLLEVSNENFVKIAVDSFIGSEPHLYPYLKHFEHNLQVKISGKHWLDLSHKNTNKGFALRHIQKELCCDASETVVFGDYNNDLEMLQHAKYSFAMQNAHPNVKSIAQYETKSNDEGGVEYILDKLISDKERLITKSR